MIFIPITIILFELFIKVYLNIDLNKLSNEGANMFLYHFSFNEFCWVHDFGNIFLSTYRTGMFAGHLINVFNLYFIFSRVLFKQIFNT